MTIGGANVTLTPAMVVPNQSVTVTGRGFTSGKELATILIGGIAVPETTSQARTRWTPVETW